MFGTLSLPGWPLRGLHNLVNCPVNGGSSRNSPVEQVYNNQMINPHNGWFVLIIKRGDLLFLLGGILPLLGGNKKYYFFYVSTVDRVNFV